ncbi:type II toxin-antitoxin system VapC family toxin [Pararhizobium sp. BT-229]|uniref:type II toxin-antitoxin system VapC family toxin n=1 Tax=Pararhizobium sp. BT-229 TaxID=2986923 RepID=UPI0021F7A61A|nr:type II toxin-antitoxin system VapC family toxin [Pararhizobium sp. BT-229]MCV9961338.1 type II toxin-antitoxin system VapC family toxin [Pararhizobium sp. BT-229]
MDTHIFLAVIEDRMEALPLRVRQEVDASDDRFYLSVASLWEIAIKHRLGKLPLKTALEELPETARNYAIELIPINENHALQSVKPEPLTRDPFDRLLLAQCAVEGLKLVTIDTALQHHPLSATAA